MKIGHRSLDLRIVCLTKRWKHHTPSGGYDRLAEALGATEIKRQEISSLPGRVVEKAWHYRFGDKPYLYNYLYEDRLAEGRAFWACWRGRAQILHVIYGDEQLDLLLRRARVLPCPLVATFHLPTEISRQRFERDQAKELARLSGAVVVSSDDLTEMRRRLGDEKVIFVPHGIDIETFAPGPPHPNGPARFVFVGFHMRDFEVAHAVMDQCRIQGLDAIFDVVLPPDKAAFFTGCTNMRLHGHISEAALIALYRAADALFLPVTGCTANNAVLEALACGTPVISTRVGGMTDYVDDQSGWLLPPDDGAAAFDCVRGLIQNRDLATAKRDGARKQAERFDWKRIAGELVAAYDRLIATGRFAG